jgi:heat shock protein HtpX
MTEVRINYRKIRHSSFKTWIGLVLGSWVGLVWGSLISLPIGIGFGVAAGSLLGGVVIVPLWGTFWGLVGLGRQRQDAVNSHGIRLLPDDDELTGRVHAMAGRLGLKTRPWVGIMPHKNAYAIGSSPNDALVVIGWPLQHMLTEKEVDAIIGHELGHIANNDMRRMGLARSFQNSLVWYLGFSKGLQEAGRWLLTWLSELCVLGLSRNREYWADAIGAALTSKQQMISALEKIHEVKDLDPFERINARLMFRGLKGGSLLSTHPTLQQRKRALEKETYLRRIPVIRAVAPRPPDVAITVPKAEEIAYAKR